MLYERFKSVQSTEDIHSLVSINSSVRRPVGGTLKRVFDLSFALAAILTFGLLIVGIALTLKIRSGGPIFFSQKRVGFDAEMFRCIKFRTMIPNAEESLEDLLRADDDAALEFATHRKLRNDPRVIPGIGSFLRKTSLDELPQFFNVIRGEMSIVGPRPVTREEFLEHYGDSHPYSAAMPGITGAWQTSGRNDLSFEERVLIDKEYIENWNLSRDIKIIWRTVSIVCLKHNGH